MEFHEQLIVTHRVVVLVAQRPGKVHPCKAVRLCTGRTVRKGSRGIALLFLEHGTRRDGVVSVTPRPFFTPREIPGTHCIGGWVGLRAGLDRYG